MPKQTPLADLLREARTTRGESLRSAARSLGVNPGYLSRVENGEKVPSVTLQARVADYFAVDEEALLLASGRVPDDILEILRTNPNVLTELRNRYGTESPD